jgi:hypothetical protein
MKKYLVLTALLCLGGLLAASGWDAATNQSGLGPFTADSVITNKVKANTGTLTIVSPYLSGRDSGQVAIRDTVRITGAGGTGRIWYDQTGGSWTTINTLATVKGTDGEMVQLVASGNSAIAMQASSAGTYTSQSHMNSTGMAFIPHKIQCSALDLTGAGRDSGTVAVRDTFKTKGLSVGGGTMLTKIVKVGSHLAIVFGTDTLWAAKDTSGF